MEEKNDALHPSGAQGEPVQGKKPKKKSSPLYDLYSLLHDLVYILAAITLIFVFCVRLVGVSGDSMYPTLHNGDYLALESNVIMGTLERGDIIVARKVDFRDGEPIVKRVIATEGETLRIYYDENHKIAVSVDGVVLDEPYINEAMIALYPVPMEVTVEKDCVFVMGDNRNHSSDSRLEDIGQIRYDEILGKVILNVFPRDEGGIDFDRLGTVS